jgi:hypothetical protein
VHLTGVEEMKKRALKIAKDVRREGTFPGHVVYGTSPLLVRASNIIEELVEHIEDLENPIMQAISQAFGASQEWQYLTDDEIKEIIGSYGEPRDGLGIYTRGLFDKIEAKIREKNEKS